ncbi:DNA primase [Streptomyces sclerotialus]|uniref:DNA primase n=1 Tax=Streptomyces sclerotialus TaxID=1957 RepID=UPI000B2F25FB
MNNRAALALAVAGGYALGRTKKMKLALTVGGMVLGRRLQLDPQRLLSLVDERLKADPQLAELREQLRDDLSGVGRAATDAFVGRRIDGLANSLHERTLGIQDRIAGGVLPQGRDADAEDGPAQEPEAEEADRAADDRPEGEDRQDEDRRDEDEQEETRAARTRTPRKKAAGKPSPARRPARTAAKSGTKAAGRTGGKAAGRTGTRTGTGSGGKAGTRSAGGARSSSGRSREGTDG